MEQNVGEMDRFLRLTAGFYLLGTGIRRSSDLLIIAGSMKIAEGITRWCPLLHILKRDTMSKNASERQEMPQEPVNTEIPIN